MRVVCYLCCLFLFMLALLGSVPPTSGLSAAPAYISILSGVALGPRGSGRRGGNPNYLPGCWLLSAFRIIAPRNAPNPRSQHHPSLGYVHLELGLDRLIEPRGGKGENTG